MVGLGLAALAASAALGTSNKFTISFNGECFDLFGGASSPTVGVDFNVIFMDTCNGGLNQQWTFTLATASPSTFSISNVLDPASVLAYPTTATGTSQQATVARLNSDITWSMVAQPTLGNDFFSLRDTTAQENAITAFSCNDFKIPLFLQTFGESTPQSFQILPV